MRTIEQERAANALGRVNELGSESKDFKERYRSYVDRLGPTIVMNGLGQALATERAAAGSEPKKPEEKAHQKLYDSVQGWLCRDGGVYPPDKDLLQVLMERDEVLYLRAQAEALAWLEWHKKCCRASFPKGRRRRRVVTLPLYKAAADQPPSREVTGHAGLWFDKFCNQWRHEESTWTMKGSDQHNPKFQWIKTLTTGKVGVDSHLQENALRLAALVESRKGHFEVFTTTSRFVTGLGRSHPVENGFAWHPTLGTPFVPGSSVKGLVHAWAKLEAEPRPDKQLRERLLGTHDKAGSLCFLDAIPVAAVQLEADVMTPHYAGWSESDPPGDWRSPTPIPFLATATETSFLFGVIPVRDVSDADLRTVQEWLRVALAWGGAGAKTAIGYGRFESNERETPNLTDELRKRQEAHETRLQAERTARDREERLAALTPTEREIEELLNTRQDRNVPEITAIIQAVKSGRWTGDAKIEAARWLKDRMTTAKKWKETSRKKQPAKDRDYQDTLTVMRWLRGEAS